MRLFSATIATGTNTLSLLPTNLDAREESVFLHPGEHPTGAPHLCTAVRRTLACRGGALHADRGKQLAASPAGTTNRADYEFMRDEVLTQLEAALPLDGVLLGQYGAVVVHGMPMWKAISWSMPVPSRSRIA
jgi:microcystin degradation protein MlrC